MATLKESLKFLDWVMDKKNPDKLYMVLAVNVHNVWVFREGDEEPIQVPKRLINMVYMKVDPKTVKVLYGDKGENIIEPGAAPIELVVASES